MDRHGPASGGRVGLLTSVQGAWAQAVHLWSVFRIRHVLLPEDEESNSVDKPAHRRKYRLPRKKIGGVGIQFIPRKIALNEWLEKSPVC
jgi:hypothetical protein